MKPTSLLAAFSLLPRLLRAAAVCSMNLYNAVTDWVRGAAALGLAGISSLLAVPFSAFVAIGSAVIRWAPAVVRIIAKSALIASPLAVAVFFIVFGITNPFVREQLDYAHDRTSAIEVFDSDGRWIGIIPPATFADWSDGSVLPADHAAVAPITIPPIWRRCIAYLEDRSAFDGVSNRLGFDPAGLAKAGIQTAFFHRRRGASTLLMQVVRTLNGQSPNVSEPLGAIVFRKVAELVGATTLAQMLRDRDPHLAERYIGMHLPLVIGASGSGFGDEIHGIELASRILFGVAAGSLRPEQQAILAAAVKVPVVLATPGDEKGNKLAVARWNRVKVRAEHCLKNVFAADPASAGDVVSRVQQLTLPTPTLDAALIGLLPRDRRMAWQVVVNPVRLAQYFAAQELRLAKAELDRGFAKNWRGRITAIRLTSSARDGRVFVSEVASGLRQLQSTVPSLSLDLTGAGATTAAQVVMALADDQGHLRRFYTSHERLFFAKKTEIGSTAKMIAAVALSRRTSPTTLYCQAPIPGMTVVAVDDRIACRVHSNWISARDAFARSNSAAVNWALRHYATHKEMEKAAAAFGLPPFGDVPPPTALSLGIVELTPAEMLRMTGAVGAMLVGASGNVPFPSVISNVTILDPDGIARTQSVVTGDPLGDDVLRSVTPPRARAFLTNVLAATSDRGGTLHALAGLKAALGGHLYAKTGTVSVKGDTQAIQIAGVVLRNGRPWSFNIMISAPDRRHPLGRKLAAGEFAHLVALILRRLGPEATAMASAPNRGWHDHGRTHERQ